MIFYYSGTGNTRYAAVTIGKAIGDKRLLFIPALVREIETGKRSASSVFAGMADDEAIGFMFPVYSWGVPPIVTRFVREVLSPLQSDRYIWSVCTCGDEAGVAMRMFSRQVRELCGKAPGLSYSVIMPNNYVLLPGFDVDTQVVAQKKLDAMPAEAAIIASKIKNREHDVYCVTEGSVPALRTHIAFPLFRRWGVNTRRWHVSDRCISCGRCVRICPACNIEILSGRPVGHDDCYSCCACFHVCPRQAVNYGRFTNGKGQYICPERGR